MVVLCSLSAATVPRVAPSTTVYVLGSRATEILPFIMSTERRERLMLSLPSARSVGHGSGLVHVSSVEQAVELGGAPGRPLAYLRAGSSAQDGRGEFGKTDLVTEAFLGSKEGKGAIFEMSYNPSPYNPSPYTELGGIAGGYGWKVTPGTRR